MLIKNVLPHPDDLHDGRPFPPYETAEITPEDFELEHYQARLRDGLIVVVTSHERPQQSVAEIVAAIEAAENPETAKAHFRKIEEAGDSPRKGVLDATKPNEENA